MGNILLFVCLFDAVMDPVIGLIPDRLKKNIEYGFSGKSFKDPLNLSFKKKP
jgi:hypothetical protein